MVGERQLILRLNSQAGDGLQYFASVLRILECLLDLDGKPPRLRIGAALGGAILKSAQADGCDELLELI